LEKSNYCIDKIFALHLIVNFKWFSLVRGGVMGYLLKHVSLIILIVPALILGQTKDRAIEEDSEIQNRKLYIKGNLLGGLGFEKIMAGKKYYEDGDDDESNLHYEIANQYRERALKGEK
jgi:hypothetical protein